MADHRSRRATWIGVGVIVAVGVAALGPHVALGGFHADDWVDAGNYYAHPGTGFLAAVAAHQDPGRRTWALLSTATFAIFGMDMAALIALTAGVSIAEALVVYLLLRQLGGAVAPACATALLLLFLPAADSTRLWANGAQMSIACLFALAGVLLTLRALRTPGALGWALHAAALLLYAASVSCYELTAPAILLAGFLYMRRGDLPTVLWRWVLDIAVVASLTVARVLSAARPVGTLDATLQHLWLIAQDGTRVGVDALIPRLTVAALPAGVGVATLVAVASAVAVLPRVPVQVRAGLRRALGLFAAGVVLTILGWAMIVPASLGYDPGSPGVGNRINVVAAIGLAVTVVAVAALLATLLRAALRGRGPSIAVLTTLLVTPVVVADLAGFELDAANWNHAATENRAVLAELQQLVPSPSPGTTLFTFGVSGYFAPSVLIFGGGGNNDLLGAAHVVYGTSRVKGFPVLSGMTFVCNASSMELLDTGTSSATTYGRALLIDLPDHQIKVPNNRQDCLSDTTALQPYAPVNESG